LRLAWSFHTGVASRKTNFEATAEVIDSPRGDTLDVFALP